MPDKEDIFTKCNNNKNIKDEEKDIELEIASIFGNNLSKQELFDRFLTYRRRLARLAAVQAIYLFEAKGCLLGSAGGNLFEQSDDNNFIETCQEVISFYKSYFFTPQEYGWVKKNKKIDEDFMFSLVANTLASLHEIDVFIQNRLTGTWVVEKLDAVLRAIIRCAVAEIMVGDFIEKAVLCSEYTNVASNFFSSKEVGFVNGIVDKLYGDVIKKHPFLSK